MSLKSVIPLVGPAIGTCRSPVPSWGSPVQGTEVTGGFFLVFSWLGQDQIKTCWPTKWWFRSAQLFLHHHRGGSISAWCSWLQRLGLNNQSNPNTLRALGRGGEGCLQTSSFPVGACAASDLPGSCCWELFCLEPLRARGRRGEKQEFPWWSWKACPNFCTSHWLTGSSPSATAPFFCGESPAVTSLPTPKRSAEGLLHPGATSSRLQHQGEEQSRWDALWLQCWVLRSRGLPTLAFSPVPHALPSLRSRSPFGPSGDKENAPRGVVKSNFIAWGTLSAKLFFPGVLDLRASRWMRETSLQRYRPMGHRSIGPYRHQPLYSQEEVKQTRGSALAMKGGGPYPKPLAQARGALLSPPRAGRNKDAHPMGHGREWGDQDPVLWESKLKSVLPIHQRVMLLNAKQGWDYMLSLSYRQIRSSQLLLFQQVQKELMIHHLISSSPTLSTFLLL